MWDKYDSLRTLTQDISGFTQACDKALPQAQRRGGQKMWKGGCSPHLHVLWQQDTLPGSPGTSLGAGPSGLSALFALLELCFTVLTDTRLLWQENRRKACLIKAAVGDSMGLYLNIGNITENMRTDNHVRARVQLALCAASTRPKYFVLSSLSLLLVIAPQHLWFTRYFLPFFLPGGDEYF